MSGQKKNAGLNLPGWHSTVQINPWPLIIFLANITRIKPLLFSETELAPGQFCKVPSNPAFWTRLTFSRTGNSPPDWATKTRFAGPKLDALSVLSTGIGISNPCAACFDRLRRSAPCLSLRFHGLQGASLARLQGNLALSQNKA